MFEKCIIATSSLALAGRRTNTLDSMGATTFVEICADKSKLTRCFFFAIKAVWKHVQFLRKRDSIRLSALLLVIHVTLRLCCIFVAAQSE